MIKKDIYLLLKRKYSKTSSWTIWKKPKDNNWSSKSNIDDLSIFYDTEKIIKKLNSKYIFVGYNPAMHNNQTTNNDVWRNFHSDDIKRGQDYKLRYALQGTKYEGSFITDIYPEIIETNSILVSNKVTSEMTNKSIKNLIEIRNILGGKAIIVAIGKKSHDILKKQLSKEIKLNKIILKKITHYACWIKIDNYKGSVISQLK